LKLLRELRARVVEALDEAVCVRDVEPLARRLAAISAEIDEQAGQREPTGSPADSLRERRERLRRRGGTSAIDRSAAPQRDTTGPDRSREDTANYGE
jgi:hypothetical protein